MGIEFTEPQAPNTEASIGECSDPDPAEKSDVPSGAKSTAGTNCCTPKSDTLPARWPGSTSGPHNRRRRRARRSRPSGASTPPLVSSQHTSVRGDGHAPKALRVSLETTHFPDPSPSATIGQPCPRPTETACLPVRQEGDAKDVGLVARETTQLLARFHVPAGAPEPIVAARRHPSAHIGRHRQAADRARRRPTKVQDPACPCVDVPQTHAVVLPCGQGLRCRPAGRPGSALVRVADETDGPP